MGTHLECEVQPKPRDQERFLREDAQSLIKMRIYPDRVYVHVCLCVYHSSGSSSSSSNGDGVSLGRIA